MAFACRMHLLGQLVNGCGVAHVGGVDGHLTRLALHKLCQLQDGGTTLERTMITAGSFGVETCHS